MTELSARARALMEQARHQATPTREELAHVRQRLSPGLAEAPRKPLVFPVSLVALGLIGALVSGVHFSGVARSFSFGSRPVQLVCLDDGLQGRGQQTQVVDRVLDDVDPTRSCRSETTQQGALAAPLLAPGAPPRSARALPVDVERDRGPIRPVDDLGLGLLEEAKLALDEHRPFDALGQVQKHFARYPQSQFHEERLAMQLIALCMAQRPELASTSHEEFARAFPESTYLPRIERSCSTVLDGGAYAD